MKWWWLPGAGRYIAAPHEPPGYHSLLSGFDPVGDPPRGLNDWSGKPVSATAATAPGPASSPAHVSPTARARRRWQDATRASIPSKLPAPSPPDAPLAHSHARCARASASTMVESCVSPRTRADITAQMGRFRRLLGIVVALATIAVLAAAAGAGPSAEPPRATLAAWP